MTGLAFLAAAAQPEELQGVEQQLEARGLLAMQVHIVHGAVFERHGGPTVHTGEVVFVPLGGGKQGLATGQVAASKMTARTTWLPLVCPLK